MLALNFRSLLGVLRTWMGERPRPRPARMTPSGRSAVNFAVMHNPLIHECGKV